ncbi:hypothetical protein THASP1DRAFT_31815 [Thamnocephalis sphaerospora]|uniref:Uncharacterized protein n=1 Tax=Thamnocephalis sphaerospora TaxID=78915 RepID=A0A4P9XKM8_9FUNG|nr:hypothetical protein THASP1DRAFT_31815 [Thamnocephalis sphaerospora]|eukprot:RKP06363.1 hypothetical protein THASP1DRAFT_31815 [Thamnocephalis sphaerospora]
MWSQLRARLSIPPQQVVCNPRLPHRILQRCLTACPPLRKEHARGTPNTDSSDVDAVHVSEVDGRRAYYYYVDEHGQLFMHDTYPRNITTCFKDRRFLDFILRRLQHNDTGHAPIAYPYLSPCGNEWNFLACADTPIVYQDLAEDGQLLWAGTRVEPFRPEALRVAPDSGRLYHPAPKSIATRPGMPTHALLRSSLVLCHLASGLTVASTESQSHVSAATFSLTLRGQTYALSTLEPADRLVPGAEPTYRG